MPGQWCDRRSGQNHRTLFPLRRTKTSYGQSHRKPAGNSAVPAQIEEPSKSNWLIIPASTVWLVTSLMSTKLRWCGCAGSRRRRAAGWCAGTYPADVVEPEPVDVGLTVQRVDVESYSGSLLGPDRTGGVLGEVLDGHVVVGVQRRFRHPAHHGVNVLHGWWGVVRSANHVAP